MIMKKLLTLALISGSLALAVPAIEASTPASSASAGDPQIRVQIGRNRNSNWRRNRSRRTAVTTRVTQVGRLRYRETIRTTYLPNGGTRTVVIRRERLARW